MERGDDFLAVSDLLSRNDLLDFVQEAVDESFSRADFDRLRMPEGTSSQTMWDFVEFVRRAGCGRVVCGKDRGCDHMGSWYALTNSLSSRIARIEHRVRPQGSLTVHFRRYIEASGYYAPLLDEVAFVLGMDGVRVEMTDLRRIARGIAGGGFVSSALHGEERLMAFVLEVLAGMDGYASELSDAPVGCDCVASLYERLDAAACEVSPRDAARHPEAPCYSICDLFGSAFLSDILTTRSSLDVSPVMFVLFCSDNCWHKAVFPRWNATMELLVRSLLLTVYGMPIFRYVPLAKPYYRWETAAETPHGGVPYGQCMSSSRFGVDMTPLFSQMLAFVEVGLDGMAHYVKDCADRVSELRGMIATSQMLNHRQKALLAELLDNPAQPTTATAYEVRFGIAASTAYADLHKLESLGLIQASLDGKSAVFRAVAGLPALVEARLR